MKKSWKLLDVSTLDFNDKKTWDLISDGNTDGVFQLASSGMKDICKRVKPHNMQELSDILALYRPDTMEELEHYIRRKNGKEKITYLHPDLKPIFESTYGCCIYQEQTMKISKVFAGFSDGEADDLRKGLGHKDKEIVKTQAEKFYKRALEKGYSEEICAELRDFLAAKGGYQFNHSHSFAYAVTSYKTAYLKANYSEFFMCSLLNSSKGNYDDLSKFINKTKQMRIKVLEPNINISKSNFSVNKGNIIFGLGIIKGIGDTSVESIEQHRPYVSFTDFTLRSETDKTTTIALIKSGAFNEFNPNKKELLNEYREATYTPTQYKKVKSLKPKKTMFELGLVKDEIEWKNKELCLMRLNAYNEQKYTEKESIRYKKYKDEFDLKYTKGSDADFQFETLSMYLTTNPYENMQDILIPYSDMKFGSNIIAGTITNIQSKTDKRGGRFAYVSLVNHEGIIIETVAWSSIYSQYQDILKKGTKIIAMGKKKDTGFSLDNIQTLERWQQKIKVREQMTHNIKETKK